MRIIIVNVAPATYEILGAVHKTRNKNLQKTVYFVYIFFVYFVPHPSTLSSLFFF